MTCSAGSVVANKAELVAFWVSDVGTVVVRVVLRAKSRSPFRLGPEQNCDTVHIVHCHTVGRQEGHHLTVSRAMFLFIEGTANKKQWPCTYTRLPPRTRALRIHELELRAKKVHHGPVESKRDFEVVDANNDVREHAMKLHCAVEFALRKHRAGADWLRSLGPSAALHQVLKSPVSRHIQPMRTLHIEQTCSHAIGSNSPGSCPGIARASLPSRVLHLHVNQSSMQTIPHVRHPGAVPARQKTTAHGAAESDRIGTKDVVLFPSSVSLREAKWRGFEIYVIRTSISVTTKRPATKASVASYPVAYVDRVQIYNSTPEVLIDDHLSPPICPQHGKA